MVARENFTFSDLENWFNERRVTEIECLVPDLTGVARGKILPREKFTEDRGMRLPEAIVAIGVTGEFPAEGPYYDVIHATDRDMHLRPDPSTVRIVPWATDPTAQVIHDCFDRDGVMIPYAPRSVLRRICDLYDAEGWAPVVAPELEFYLIERNADRDRCDSRCAPTAPRRAPLRGALAAARCGGARAGSTCSSRWPRASPTRAAAAFPPRARRGRSTRGCPSRPPPAPSGRARARRWAAA